MSSIEIQTETKRKMEKTLEIMKDELKSIRTGRATPGLVENLKISCYGSLTPLKQLANTRTTNTNTTNTDRKSVV